MRSRAYPVVQASAERPAVRKTDRGLVATFVAFVVIACVTFLALAAEFLQGTHDFDRTLLFGLPGPHDPAGPNGPKRLVDIAWSITALGSPEILAVLTAGVVGYLTVARRSGAALLVLASIGGGTLIAFGVKAFFEYLLPHHSAGFQGSSADTSFPSGHAMLAAIVYLTLAVVWVRSEPRLRIKVYVIAFAAILSGLVGASRVYLGLHWPSDILAGWIVGLTWAALLWVGMRIPPQQDT